GWPQRQGRLRRNGAAREKCRSFRLLLDLRPLVSSAVRQRSQIQSRINSTIRATGLSRACKMTGLTLREGRSMAKPDKAAENVATGGRWRRRPGEDLEAPTAPRSLDRGRRYQRTRRVRELARTENGDLLAWVQGTQRYATQVGLISEGKS